MFPGVLAEWGAVLNSDRIDLLIRSGKVSAATTNKGGKYNIGNVPEGSNHTVTAEADGFMTEQITDVEVFDGQTTAGVDFALVPDG